MLSLSHCARLVKERDRDRFLNALFAPPEAREALLALAALNAELAQVRLAVREEMIGHIRHAWWQESLEALYAGKPPAHPVLQAFPAAHLPRVEAMALAQSYRERFPDPPLDADARVDSLSLELLRILAPQAEAGWRKAQGIIARHRVRHGQGRSGWLYVKLLWAGR